MAGADAEALYEGDVDKFIELHKKYPGFAEYAWCIAKRNEAPWRKPSNEQEQAAVDYAKELLK